MAYSYGAQDPRGMCQSTTSEYVEAHTNPFDESQARMPSTSAPPRCPGTAHTSTSWGGAGGGCSTGSCGTGGCSTGGCCGG